MSYTELHTGELELITPSFDRNDFNHLMSTEVLRTDYDVMMDDFFFLEDADENKKYLFNKGHLYKVNNHIKHDNSEYLNEFSENGDKINFTCLFYNGGTCLNEMLEETLDSIQ